MLKETGERRDLYSFAQAECIARERLMSKLSETQCHSYVVNDAFTEIGVSGVRYLIRKNRPTLAFRYSEEFDWSRPLCALCLHPLGYYKGTWAGVMPPSDEMLTHLLYIRSDEHFFWKKAN